MGSLAIDRLNKSGNYFQCSAQFRLIQLHQDHMKLLNTYEDREEAQEAAKKLVGEKRLASERDATVTIYNLFGIPNWGNFHRLGMYNLGELKLLLERRAIWSEGDQARHTEIIATLRVVAKNYEIEVPAHWM